MNAGSVPLHDAVKSASEPREREQFQQWRQVLADCADKLSRKRIHGLRVATLRLMVEIDFWLLNHDADDPISRVAKSWKKQANKLRKALSPVRDSDVYVAKLKKILKTDRRHGDEWHLTPGCRREIQKLEAYLKDRRASTEKELLQQIKKCREKSDRLTKKLEDDLGRRTVWADSDRVRVVRGLIAGLATELPNLTAEVLHDFRKQAKMARYLSEVLAARNPHAANQAALLKRMQDAAGEWHDWQTLASVARRVCGRDKENEFVRLLDQFADKSLSNALDLSRRGVAQLLKLNDRNEVSRDALPPKKPVKRAEPEAVKEDKRYA
jgi:CHAD domain-containing protein